MSPTPGRRTGPTADRRTGPKPNAAEAIGTSSVVEDSHLAQMRRRQEAAQRLPPLADGRRDPQFDLYPRDGAA